jgi:hypothetical protein
MYAVFGRAGIVRWSSVSRRTGVDLLDDEISAGALGRDGRIERIAQCSLAAAYAERDAELRT